MKDKEIEIPKNDAFKNCKLNRKEQADVLTSIIDVYKEGFVLSVDGKWGTGKSTFMKMWRQYLIDNGYKTILFNAWENDFTSDPLIAIMGEIKQTFFEDAEKLNSITNKLASISKSFIPVLAKTFASLSGYGQISDVVEKFSAVFSEEVESYATRKETLIELRTELSKFVKQYSKNKPLVFIVDELDRCRPDYAVEVLEKIKHFFSVDGIVFVLSIDKLQLCQAIKGYYGSEGLDSPEYLRRFIDLEYTLPEPNYENYCNYVFEKYEFGKFFYNAERNRYNFGNEKDNFNSISTFISSSQKLSLRQVNKLYAQTKIATRLCPLDEYAHTELIFVLIYIKTFYFSVYQKIISGSFSIQELVTQLEDVFEDAIKMESRERYTKFISFSVVELIKSYNCVINRSFPSKSLLLENDGKKNLTFEVRSLDIDFMLRGIEDYRRDPISLYHYTKKIDLLDSFQN